MKQLSIVVLTALLFTGCASTRSISNSNYRVPENSHARITSSESAFSYRGELNEFDVLGISRDVSVSDTEIEQALTAAKRIRLQPGNSILLVQSGAVFPDGPMITELSKHFRVMPFSGIPPASQSTAEALFPGNAAETFSKSLRLAAARGGNDLILCYWGILESEDAKLPTKTVSWVPVVNWMLPDERQHMRIRLKIALVDVRTGDWAVVSPAPVKGSKISVSPRRGVADQKLVETLKEQAYVAGVEELLQQYAEVTAARRSAVDSSDLGSSFESRICSIGTENSNR